MLKSNLENKTPFRIALVNGGYGELAFTFASLLSDRGSTIKSEVELPFIEIYVFDRNVLATPAVSIFRNNSMPCYYSTVEHFQPLKEKNGLTDTPILVCFSSEAFFPAVKPTSCPDFVFDVVLLENHDWSHQVPACYLTSLLLEARRFYLFDLAFAELNPMDEDDGSKGHLGLISADWYSTAVEDVRQYAYPFVVSQKKNRCRLFSDH